MKGRPQLSAERVMKMDIEKLTDKLGKISDVLNGIGGRLIVASMRDPVIREAHEMALTLGAEIDDLINDLLGQEATK